MSDEPYLMRQHSDRPAGRMVKVSAGAVIALAGVTLLAWPLWPYASWAWRRVSGGVTVAERLGQYGPAARARLQPAFTEAGVPYPPAELVLVGIKDRKQLELWARDAGGPFRHVRTYPILAASGGPGPKLRQGDRQVPEGLYRIESLHPNSLYHLALRVNYPNAHDRRQAAAEGRTHLGGDIMIHGSDGSVGCLAMGDRAAEDLFVLVAETGLANTRVILTPVDFRTSELPEQAAELPAWTGQLYSAIRRALEPLRAGEDAGLDAAPHPASPRP